MKKNGQAKYRMAIDLRPVNAITVPVVWPMPHLEYEAIDFAGSTLFSSIDFVSGYWQLPLDLDTAGSHSKITPNAVYLPTITLQGATNSCANFQAKVEQLFAELRDNLKAWLNDLLLHCEGEDKLLSVLRQFFAICRVK